MAFQSKLPNQGLSIFSVMSKLARDEKAINLAQGFPNFDCDPHLIDLVNQNMMIGNNQYAPMAGLLALREIISEKIESLYQVKIDPAQEVTVTAGATQAIYNSIQAVVHPGDEVIIIEPAYDSYSPAIKMCGGVTISYQLTAPEFKVNWAELSALITDKTKMLIINTPHNPTATRLDKNDMESLEGLLSVKDIFLLSDEVYEHLVYDDQKHESILAYPELYRKSFVTFSFGKTFHATGWKIGYVVAPPMLTEEFRKIHQFTVFSVNTPVQHALATYMQNPKSYLSLPSYYQQKRDLFLEAMNGSSLKPLPSYGTYYALFDYSAISNKREFEFATELTKNIKVATIPVSAFYSQPIENKVLRICFAKKEDTLIEAAKRLCSI